ncbi:MAG: DUF6603 domain-containing protein [Blastocatellia bacterium]
MTLRKAGPEMAAFQSLFEIALETDQLVVDQAQLQLGENGDPQITGLANIWGFAATRVRLNYKADPGRIYLIQFSKSLTAFEGVDISNILPHVSFEEMQLQMQADVPNDGDSDISIIALDLTGKLRIGQAPPLSFRIQHPGASERYSIEFDFSKEPAPGLEGLASLLGSEENPSQDLKWLPDQLQVKPFAIEDILLGIDLKDARKLVRIGVALAIAPGESWEVIPNFLSVGNLRVSLEVDHPLDAAYRHPVLTVGGVIHFGDDPNNGNLQLTARWPDFAIRGELMKGNDIPLGELLKKAGLSLEGLPSGKDALAISQLSFLAEPVGDPKEFNFVIAIDNVWSFQLPDKETLEITELSLFLNYSSAPDIGMGGQFTGKFRIAGIDLFMQATHTSAGAGWQFEGGTGPDQKIPIGDLLADLEKRMGITDIPASLHELEIENLRVAIDTMAKSFFFTVETKFTVNGKPVDTVLTIDLKRGENNYSSFVGGKIVIDPLEFDLIFSRDKNATMFLASYRNLAGGKLPITRLLQAVNAGQEVLDAAAEIEIDLKDALFAYDKQNAAPPPAPASKMLFALDIGGGINLSNLPFVGKLFPNDQSLRAMFQPIVNSADFRKEEVSAVKQLIPPGGIMLPDAENGYTSRFLITGTLQIGDKAFPFGQEIGKSQESALRGATGAGGGSPTAALPPPPLAKTDNVKWFDVQKSLGPVSFKRVGVQFDSGILWFLLDGSLAAGPLEIALDGLAAGSSLKKFEPQFSLRGMSVDFSQGGVEIGGAFLRRPGQNGDEDEFDGLAIIRAEVFTLSALGSYTRRQGHPSLFIYGVLDYPLGGPAFFFITGLAAGFGFNRSLKMPAIEQVAGFPLVSQAINSPGKPQNLEAVLESLRSYVPPDIGQIFLCAGIRFSTFEIIDSFALLAIQFGNRFEIDLLGLSTLVVPTPEEGSAVTPLAEVQMALKATFAPDEGFLGIQAQLTANSFVLSRDCHLTGGFAFFTWFKDGYLGGRAGDFVITLGGYHPAYRKPAYYPDVPRVGFNWQVSSELSIKGGLYFALTGNALMAGGGLQALWDSGALKAWFLIGADFLIAWKPYHYDARVYLDIGISFTFNLFGTHTITLELGADLHIWGPDFSGVAKLYILIFTVTINFGADASPKPMPIDWPTFRGSFLPADDTKFCSVMVSSGLVKKSTDDNDDLGIIDPKHFTLVTSSPAPLKSVAWTGAKSWQLDDPAAEMPGNRNIHIGSMAITDDGLESAANITITLDGEVLDGSAGRPNPFKITPVLKNVPAGLWGTDLTPDLNSSAMIINAITGFEIAPAEPPAAGHTRDIERKELAYETTPSQTHFYWSEALPKFGEQQPDARQRIEKTLRAESQAANRGRLLKQWGLREDREVRLRPGYAANLMGNPRIISEE